MDYDAEVAYISMTSPVGDEAKQPRAELDDEFDFSLSNAKSETSKDSAADRNPKDSNPSPSQGKKSPIKRKRNPPLLSKLSIPRISESDLLKMDSVTSARETSPERETSPGKETSTDRKQSLSPLSLEGIPHFSIDTESPRTPTSQLRRIKQAQQEATPPSPKAKSKLQTGQHLYCTLVLYGSSGCGRTHLVNKLAQSNLSIFAKVVTSTTRKRRANEVNGVDFHFITHKEMSRRVVLGDFLEHVTISRKRRGTTALQRQLLSKKQSFDSPSPPMPRSNTISSAESAPSLEAAAKKPELGRHYDSAFELREEDSPVAGGEIFGTSHQAMTEAVQQGKPCILLNVSIRSAQQLASSGLEASYILVQNSPTSRDKPPREGGGLHPQHVISAASLDHAYSELRDYAFQLVSDLKLPLTSNYEASKYEWDALPTIGFDHSEPVPHKKMVEVNFSELLAHFQSSAMKKYIERARAEVTKPKMFLRTKLSKKLMEERLIVQATSHCSLNDKESLHIRMLQTIYSKLTSNTLNCRRFSSHWQEIGFSGVDPADDLQEVGLLGPTQLIYFLDNPQTAQICKEIFHHCHIGDSQATPFCALSFTFTKFSMEVLEEGLLNKLCNKKDQVFAVVSDFYMAAFHYYYKTWRSSRKSLLELGLLQHNCQEYCRSHVLHVLRDYQELTSARKPQNAILSEVPKTELLFTPMNDIKDS